MSFASRVSSAVMMLNGSLAQIAADLYLPAIPAIAVALHVEVNQVQWSVTTYLLGMMLAQALIAPLSDRFGRRTLNLIGFVSITLGSFLSVMVPDVHMLWWMRFLMGVGAGMTFSLFYAMARDQYAGKKLMTFDSYAASLRVLLLSFVPLLGSVLLVRWGWASIFLWLSGIAAVLLLLNIMCVPETQKKSSDLCLSNVWTVIKNPIVLGSSLVVGSLYGAIVAWLVIGPVILQRAFMWQPAQYAETFVFIGAAYILGAWGNTVFVRTMDNSRVKRWSLVLWVGTIMVLCMAEWAHQMHAATLVGSAIVLLHISGWVLPRMAASALMPEPELAGLSTAVFLTIRVLGGVLSSAWIVHHAGEQVHAFIVTLLITCLLASVGWWQLSTTEDPLG